MKGTVTLEVENGEKTVLKEGDTCVQRGTLHSWKNESTEWCRMVFFIVGTSSLRLICTVFRLMQAFSYRSSPGRGGWKASC